MRRFASALAVASLLGCSFAFAQTATPGGAGSQNAPPAEPPSAAPNGSTTEPGAATSEHAKHMSKKACTKEAKTKQLTGDEKKQFIKDCEHGKTTE